MRSAITVFAGRSESVVHREKHFNAAVTEAGTVTSIAPSRDSLKTIRCRGDADGVALHCSCLHANHREPPHRGLRVATRSTFSESMARPGLNEWVRKIQLHSLLLLSPNSSPIWSTEHAILSAFCFPSDLSQRRLDIEIQRAVRATCLSQHRVSESELAREKGRSLSDFLKNS